VATTLKTEPMLNLSCSYAVRHQALLQPLSQWYGRRCQFAGTMLDSLPLVMMLKWPLQKCLCSFVS